MHTVWPERHAVYAGFISLAVLFVVVFKISKSRDVVKPDDFA